MTTPHERRPAGTGFWLAGWAATMVVGSLLLRDARAASDDRTLFAVAMVLGAIPAVRFARATSIVAVFADAVAAAGLSAIAVATYPIGGLAFLLPVVFMMLAAIGDRTSRKENPANRRLARGVLAGAIVLLIASLFDPGGAVFAIAPLALVLIAWSAASLRRAG